MRINKLFYLLPLFLISCQSKQVRAPGCDLDWINAHGCISRIEIITQSDMPVSEMVYNYFDYKTTYSFLFGNNAVTFDKAGFVNKQAVYNNEGKVLFSGRCANGAKKSLVSLFQNDEYSGLRVEGKRNDANQLIEQRFFRDNQLLAICSFSYNEQGDISRISTEYPQLGFQGKWFSSQWIDTTVIDYPRRDSYGNWLEACIQFVGHSSRQNYSMKVRRAITYWNDPQGAPLVNQLGAFIKEGREKPMDVHCSPYAFANTLMCKIPDSFEINTTLGLPTSRYTCFSSKEKDDHATIAFEKEATELESIVGMSIYGEEIKAELGKGLVQGGIKLLQWNALEETRVNGNPCLVIRYTRLGQGSPIPVAVEIYQFIKRGYIYRVTISYQTNKTGKYQPLLNSCVDSIQL